MNTKYLEHTRKFRLKTVDDGLFIKLLISVFDLHPLDCIPVSQYPYYHFFIHSSPYPYPQNQEKSNQEDLNFIQSLHYVGLYASKN